MKRMLIAMSAACVPLLSVAAPPSIEPVDVNVTNPVLPVEVSNADPVPVTPPLWQGTPYVSTVVQIGGGCKDFKAIPAGMVLFVQRITVSFNVAPGQNGSGALGLTVLGANDINYLEVPTYPSGPVLQTFGTYDGYEGSMEVGLPAEATPAGCLFAVLGANARGQLTVTGYLVPAP